MTSTLTPDEQAQVTQTIEMFEVIAESQPHDYQSLEILKEAYSKLGREKDVVATSKRIAQAYVAMGQLSSAILEYETILQRFPDDTEVQAALKEIETQANNFPEDTSVEEPAPAPAAAPAKSNGAPKSPKPASRIAPAEVEDGRRVMQKIFVETKIISAADFDANWPVPDLSRVPESVIEPFVQALADKGILGIEHSLKAISDKSRVAYVPLQLYDIDMDLARSFPADICRRWCVLPIDRMSKSILVATCNPFNQQAAKELAEATPNRLLWYLAPPLELVKNIKKSFR